MTVPEQADSTLRRARTKAIRAKVFGNLALLNFHPTLVERRLCDEDWTCYLAAWTARGELITGAKIKIKTPSPLEFERMYAWEEIEFCPMWIEIYENGEHIRLSRGTKPSLKIGVQES